MTAKLDINIECVTGYLDTFLDDRQTSPSGDLSQM